MVLKDLLSTDTLAAGAAVGCVAHAVRPIAAAAITMAASGLFIFLILNSSFSFSTFILQEKWKSCISFLLTFQVKIHRF